MILRLILLALLCFPSALSQVVPANEARFDSLAQKGISQVYNLEFEAAEQTFHDLTALQPSHPAGYFFFAMVDWWKIMIDLDNEEYDDRFLGQLDRVVAMCDSMLDLNAGDVTAIFFKGGAIGFQGRLRFHRDDYLGAANAGRKALPLVQTASTLEPNNDDILLGTGIYHYYAEVIPDQFPIARPLLLFIPPGDKKKGLEELNAAAERGKYASAEATYFLLQIYFFYEKDFTSALALSTKLHRRYPNNMLFHRYVGRCQTMLANWAQSREVFGEIVARVRRGERGYTPTVEREAEYYLGVAWMAFGMPDEALLHYYRCDELSRSLDRRESSGFMAMANLKIGNIYDLQLKRDQAIQQYNKVLSLKDYRGSHDQAEVYLKNPYGR
jgi:tetratricopeptide (TPR) repeat protein